MKSDGVGDDEVPPDLWRDILSILPVKSILRFRSVCKSWYSLISCPDFISDYSIGKNANRVLLQHFDRTNDSHLFSSHDESFMESYDYEPGDDFNSSVQARKIVGSCNGLICLSNDPDSDVQDADILLWNPAVRKIVELPRRTNPLGGYGFTYFGFGFDPKSRDYKVLCAGENETYPGVTVSLCEIYDLSKGVWRGIRRRVTSCQPSQREHEFYLNGALHWIAYNKNVLLSFNMSDEIWREMSMPVCAEFAINHDKSDWMWECNTSTRGGTFDGLIYLIRWKADSMAAISSVWVMKEYGVTESWTKLFNIDMQSSPAFSDASPHKFRLWKYGKVLVVHHQEDKIDTDDTFVGEQELSLYNGESKILKRIFSSTKEFVDLCFYEESLILM